ncbi:MAG: glycosyltransferase [Xanthomonadales bacterium]|nr:glycosyltransferase [Xanthomonadales bacterium]
MRRATLLVLAWNQWALTRRCLDTLLDTDLDAAEVIVVDNGSDDDTPAGVAAYAGRVRLLRLPANLGFVRGMNAGIAAARVDDDIVLLNNDLEFTQRDWLGRLRDAAYAAPDHGIVGCRLRGSGDDERLYHTASFIEPETLWGQQTESGQQERDFGQYTRMRRVHSIAFAVAYLRRDCIERVGVLDEAYHSYFEDTDFCLRARDAGIASVVAGAVTLRHEQHGSTRDDDDGFRARLWRESRATFAARWQQRLIETRRGSLLWRGSTRAAHASAALTRELAWRLDARGVRMTYTPARAELFDPTDYRLELAARRDPDVLHDVALDCQPTVGTPGNGRLRVTCSFNEWLQPPAAWVAACNRFDRVLVPDAYQAEAHARAGVIVPIDIVALGVDPNYFHPGIESPRHPDGHFVFLSTAEQLGRDAPDVLVAAFRRAFDLEDPVELLVHLEPGNDEARIREVLAPLLAPIEGGRVRLIGGGFPHYQRTQLVAAADAYVSARRGTGWDAFAREAVASGRILVAPAFGSQRDLVDTYGRAVSVRGGVDDPEQAGSAWADIDVEDLVGALRKTFDERVTASSRARSAAADFSAGNDFDATADRLITLFASAGMLKPAARAVAPHRPADLPGASSQIVVLGMHRSGTSSIGGLLALFGAWPGPHERLLRGDDNPKGHFEHGELHMACVRRLAAAGGDWRRVPDGAPPGHAVDAFRREAGSVLDTLEQRRPWFIKEPRLCLVANELLPLLTRPVFVHVSRDPLAVADSLARRDGMAPVDALALWERYTRAAFAASAGWTRVLVDYDELVSAPVTTARRLYDDLVRAGVRGLALPAEATILAWIEPAARAVTDARPASLTPSQCALRDAIRDRSILPAPPTDAE